MTTQSVNMARLLEAAAERTPERPALVVQQEVRGRWSYRQWTFRELRNEVDRRAYALRAAGIAPGLRTVLMVRPGLEFIALFFALLKLGAVVVLVDPGMGSKNLGVCLAEAEPEAFIGIELAHLGRRLLGWAKRTTRIHLSVGRWGGRQLASLLPLEPQPFPCAATAAEDPAGVFFTSGSTGVPKGVVYTHGILCAQVQFLRDQFGFSNEEADLATFPLFALFDPCLGITAVIPAMNASKPGQANPRNLVAALRDQRCTQMFGSPALVDRLSRHCQQEQIVLPELRRVLSAGAPVRTDILERLMSVLSPEARVYTPYGATEALPVALMEGHEILEETRHETAQGGGICVGRPIPEICVEIIRITDEPIAEWSDDLRVAPGEIGEIVVAGPVVTREYFRRPQSNALAKIRTAGGEVMHRMGDVGRIDARGRLWYCGRKSHRVETTDGTLFTECVEGIFNEHVFRSALIGVGPRGDQSPVVWVDLGLGRAKRDRVRDQRIAWTQQRAELLEIASAHSMTRLIGTFLPHPDFPVDIRHNAKINRDLLARRAARRVQFVRVQLQP